MFASFRKGFCAVGQNLANTSWAFATLRVADERFFDSVAKASKSYAPYAHDENSEVPSYLSSSLKAFSAAGGGSPM